MPAALRPCLIRAFRDGRSDAAQLTCAYLHSSWAGRGAGDGNRTRMASLEGWVSPIDLPPGGCPDSVPARVPPPRAGSSRVGGDLDSTRHGVWRSLVAHPL